MVMSRRTRNVLLFVLSAIVGMLLLSAFAYWWYGGNIKPSLDAQFMPTAQALIENPAPIPSFIWGILPEPGSIIEREERICITIDAPRLDISAYDFGDWTRFYINNERAPWTGVSMVGPLRPEGYYEMPQMCIWPPLEQGLHLFEIKIGTSVLVALNPRRARTYTWAYRVE
jgi:hypothetical protein